MALEFWSTVASIGTFVVIAATAAAALVQLRHMRSSNQIAALTEVRETLESEEFRAARYFVETEVSKLLADPIGRETLARSPLPRELDPIRTLANFFETMGAFVRFGIIDREIACNLWGNVALTTWENLGPVAAIRRAAFPSLWENFEYFAVLSEDYASAHPKGTYPEGMRRMKFGERASAAARAATDGATRETVHSVE